MKPARCIICEKYAVEEAEAHRGDWVGFADLDAAGVDSLTHPKGLEYFCAAHLSGAQALRHLTAAEAVAELRIRPSTMEGETAMKPRRPDSWLRRAIKTLAR